MNPNQSCFVYIIASRSHNLYTGVTNNLQRRLLEHRDGLIPGFAKRYRIHRLVYYESFGNIRAAIAREKQIKGWDRKKRVALIEASNPMWTDLAETLFQEKSRSLGPQIGPRDDTSGTATSEPEREGAAPWDRRQELRFPRVSPTEAHSDSLAQNPSPKF